MIPYLQNSSQVELLVSKVETLFFVSSQIKSEFLTHYDILVPTHIILTPVSVWVAVLSQGHLDVLHLLGDSRQHSLLQTVELVEAAPGSHLTQTHEDTTHGLKQRRSIKEISELNNQRTKSCKKNKQQASDSVLAIN